VDVRFKCPYCDIRFAKQLDALSHIKACGERKREPTPPPDPDPKTEWALTENDKKLLSSLRIEPV
jgi:hypothetical protein